MAVACVFLHVLPELAAGQARVREHLELDALLDRHVYLIALFSAFALGARGYAVVSLLAA